MFYKDYNKIYMYVCLVGAWYGMILNIVDNQTGWCYGLPVCVCWGYVDIWIWHHILDISEGNDWNICYNKLSLKNLRSLFNH